MELLGTTSYICLFLALAEAFVPFRFAFALLVITAPLTTVAVFNVGESSVVLYQIIYLVFTLRFLLFAYRQRASIDWAFVPFLMYCLVSIPLAIFNGDVYVLNIDDEYANVSFSFQQVTQWIYLFIAISTAIYTECCLRFAVVSLDDLFDWLDFGLALVLLVALLQYFMPTEFINEFFRNSVHTGYNWDTSRLSSTFSEPSFLSLYIVPLMAMQVVRLAVIPKPRHLVLLVLSLILCLQNVSSSAIVGLAVIFVWMVPCFMAMAAKKRVPHIVYLIVVIAIFGLVFAALAGVFDLTIQKALAKLNGESASGILRSESFSVTMGAFLSSPVFGIGFGTARSYDLFSTWLATVGVVGCLLFFVPFAASIIELAKGGLTRGGGQSSSIALYLIVAMAIMLVSVPEPYFLSFWIVLGGARFLVEQEGNREQLDCPDKGSVCSERRVR